MKNVKITVSFPFRINKLGIWDKQPAHGIPKLPTYHVISYTKGMVLICFLFFAGSHPPLTVLDKNSIRVIFHFAKVS